MKYNKYGNYNYISINKLCNLLNNNVNLGIVMALGKLKISYVNSKNTKYLIDIDNFKTNMNLNNKNYTGFTEVVFLDLISQGLIYKYNDEMDVGFSNKESLYSNNLNLAKKIFK